MDQQSKDRERARKLSEHVRLMNAHGAGSPEEMAFVEQHILDTDFIELAQTARLLKRVLAPKEDR